ncbi:MAG TPA: hypothetical protein VFS16_03970 [Acidimicrobiia bacterium]|nr:hypothetical protein [Acidimicrobiia bacterium]
MAHADEGIVLTEHERETLAQLAESIGDPWLARQLVGQDSAVRSPRRRRRPSWLRAPDLKVLSGWAGGLLVAVGAVLALATFALSTALGALGLAIMGVGLWRLVEERGESVARWAATRRAEPRPGSPAGPPRPPRKPPAAA